MFRSIEFVDDIFTDEVTPYVAPFCVADEYRRLFSQGEEKETKAREDAGEPFQKRDTFKTTEEAGEEIKEEKKEGTTDETTDDTTKDLMQEKSMLSASMGRKKETWKRAENSYHGIREAYETLPDVYWQNRDILFFLRNRDDVEGLRNILLFLYTVNLYFGEGIKEESALVEKVLWMNHQYIRPREEEKEVVKQVKLIAGKCKDIKGNLHLKNDTILKFLPFTKEELWETSGNYFDGQSEEFILKRRKNKNKAHRKKVKVFASERRQQKADILKEMLRNDLQISYGDVKDVLFISEKLFYKTKREVKEELGIVPPDYLAPIRRNIDISYKEYKSLFPECQRKTYTKRKRKVKEELGIKKPDYLAPIVENPNITYKEYKELFPRCEVRTFKKRKEKVLG